MLGESVVWCNWIWLLRVWWGAGADVGVMDGFDLVLCARCVWLGAAPGLILCRLGAATTLASKLLQNILLNIRKNPYLTRVFVA